LAQEQKLAQKPLKSEPSSELEFSEILKLQKTLARGI